MLCFYMEALHYITFSYIQQLITPVVAVIEASCFEMVR